MRIELKDYINNPKGLSEALEITTDQVLSSINTDKQNICMSNNFSFGNNITCGEVDCDKCPFDTTIEDAINWLKS